MNRFFGELNGVDGWRQLLADPEKHWRTGYSARALAHCWVEADGFPPEITALLESGENQALRNLRPLEMIPEYVVKMGGRGHGSQNDLLVRAEAGDGLPISLMIEGKVDESFDTTLGVWKSKGPSIESRSQRLDNICAHLGLRPDDVLDTIFYQLLHRTASAVIEAERMGASYAAMIVHSFSQTDAHFADFQQFIGLYGATAQVSQLIELPPIRQVRLFVGWARGHEHYLTV